MTQQDTTKRREQFQNIPGEVLRKFKGANERVRFRPYVRAWAKLVVVGSVVAAGTMEYLYIRFPEQIGDPEAGSIFLDPTLSLLEEFVTFYLLCGLLMCFAYALELGVVTAMETVDKE